MKMKFTLVEFSTDVAHVISDFPSIDVNRFQTFRNDFEKSNSLAFINSVDFSNSTWFQCGFKLTSSRSWIKNEKIASSWLTTSPRKLINWKKGAYDWSIYRDRWLNTPICGEFIENLVHELFYLLNHVSRTRHHPWIHPLNTISGIQWVQLILFCILQKSQHRE